MKPEPKTRKHRTQGHQIAVRHGYAESSRDGASSGILSTNSSNHNRVDIGNVAGGSVTVEKVFTIVRGPPPSSSNLLTTTNTSRKPPTPPSAAPPKPNPTSPPSAGLPTPKAKPKQHPQPLRNSSTSPPRLPLARLPPGAAKTSAVPPASASPPPQCTSLPRRPRGSRCVCRSLQMYTPCRSPVPPRSPGL